MWSLAGFCQNKNIDMRKLLADWNHQEFFVPIYADFVQKLHWKNIFQK